MAVGGPKILKTVCKFSTPNPYIDNAHTLLASIPQYIGKLENNLASHTDEVGFFKRAHKFAGPRN